MQHFRWQISRRRRLQAAFFVHGEASESWHDRAPRRASWTHGQACEASLTASKVLSRLNSDGSQRRFCSWTSWLLGPRKRHQKTQGLRRTVHSVSGPLVPSSEK